MCHRIFEFKKYIFTLLVIQVYFDLTFWFLFIVTDHMNCNGTSQHINCSNGESSHFFSSILL